MSHLFNDDGDSSDENTNFKTENEYAKKYDAWRQKEELNKLKTKYGEDVLDKGEDSSSSSSDDEEGIELTKDVERDFFRTLSCLKNKDPRIYNNDVNFFQESTDIKTKKNKKDKPMFIKDYERNLILEKGGILSDEEEDLETPQSLTYNEEQRKIKDSFKNALGNSDDEGNDNNWGGVFKKREKTKEEIDKEESDYKKWLAGEKASLEDEAVVKDLKPLKEYWNDPNLDKGEKFLKDYILNKRYLDNEDENYVPTYDEIIHDSDQDLSNDEEILSKQEEFEHKYNFRFEEPDQEFIKRYPRTMENSVRRTDDRRKVKRQEVKERKKEEKEQKMQELKKMQEYKRKEIEEKLEKLKEITGNETLGFNVCYSTHILFVLIKNLQDDDIDGDFDPEEHDKKMQALFNEEFYAEPEDDQKPEFPDLDEELEIENWERYTPKPEDNEPHCEDDDFNMDCEYDPHQANDSTTADDESKGRRKKKRKSKFAKAVSKPKPKFDPTDAQFEKYFDEYYKLDCEDIIGDIPCRFKYRKVVPNDFGLTTEEILLANERELNKWCSLKKAVQIRSDEVEKYEQIAYKKKGQNINLKQKILPSLFSNTPEENSQNGESSVTKKEETSSVIHKSEPKENSDSTKELTETQNNGETSKITKKKNKNNKKAVKIEDTNQNDQTSADPNSNKRKRNSNETAEIKNKKRKRFNKEKDAKLPISDARLSAYGINPKKFKNKLKYKKSEAK
ncbi:unnamed protein product [Phyllotreta striolata]|uniref:Protein KRI1 homolog n=1 Tax=Phyllotreta striolata TaxID=444603 RepID=A0A9N9TYQ6_PHYSR|nr:unnamed protein product [Phyllotreta striolata]